MCSCVCAQSVKVNAAFPITLHQYLNPSCQLVQPASLEDNGKYASVAIPGIAEEVYSPELAKTDFLVLSSNVPKRLARLARASGFRVKSNKNNETVASPQVLSEAGSGPCPGTQQALQATADQRSQRRRQIQSKVYQLNIYQLNFGGVQPPTLISSPQPHSNASPVQVSPASASHKGGNPKYSGIVIISALVGTDGSISQVKVVQSAKNDLDQKGVEFLESLKFKPARKDGLPVPFLFDLSVDFRLY
jgi:TonB family protein